MTRRALLFCCAANGAAFWPVASHAATQPTPELQALDDALPGDLINDPTRLDWNVYGPGMKRKTIRNPAIPGGGVALQVMSPNAGLQPHEITAEAPITQAITSGAAIVVAFYARTIKAETADGKGVLGVRVQQNVTPWAGFGDQRLAVGSEWTLHQVKMQAGMAISRGTAIVAFQMGGAKQTIEIGQTYVLDMSGVSSG